MDESPKASFAKDFRKLKAQLATLRQQRAQTVAKYESSKASHASTMAAFAKAEQANKDRYAEKLKSIQQNHEAKLAAIREKHAARRAADGVTPERAAQIMEQLKAKKAAVKKPAEKASEKKSSGGDIKNASFADLKAKYDAEAAAGGALKGTPEFKEVTKELKRRGIATITELYKRAEEEKEGRGAEQTGPRGGRYYLSASGQKVYVK